MIGTTLAETDLEKSPPVEKARDPRYLFWNNGLVIKTQDMLGETDEKI